MVAIERANPRLKGVLPKDYARPGLDKQRLSELIDVIATIELCRKQEVRPNIPKPQSHQAVLRQLPATMLPDIVADLEAALEQFAAIEEDLKS